jgi:hypothetical protein
MKSLAAATTPIILPWPFQSGLEAATQALFDPGDRSSTDFLRPIGEADWCRWTRYRGACSKIRCRFSLVALLPSYWNLQSRVCVPVCGSARPSVPIQFDG